MNPYVSRLSSRPRPVFVFLDTDKHPSPFDMMLVSDIFPDAQILSYGQVGPEDTRKLILDIIFPRGPKGCKATKLFIYGEDIKKADANLKAALQAMVPPFEVAIMTDPKGSHTTAAAAVAKMMKCLGVKLKNLEVAVLAATGPVGRLASAILASEGARVRVTSRSLERAESLASELNSEYKGSVEGYQARTQDEVGAAIRGCRVVLSTAAAGTLILNRQTLATYGDECVLLADVNTVPPYAIEGLPAEADGDEILPGVKGVGGLAIGALKLKLEKHLLKRLMTMDKGVIDYKDGFAAAKEMILGDIK